MVRKKVADITSMLIFAGILTGAYYFLVHCDVTAMKRTSL